MDWIWLCFGLALDLLWFQFRCTFWSQFGLVSFWLQFEFGLVKARLFSIVQENDKVCYFEYRLSTFILPPNLTQDCRGRVNPGDY